VYDCSGVDRVDEQIVMNGSIPGNVRNAVESQRQEKVYVDAYAMLRAQFSATDAPRQCFTWQFSRKRVISLLVYSCFSISEKTGFL